MNKRSKILAGSSIFAFLAMGDSGIALGLAYSGGLFALFPALSSIGMSTIGPILIATTALFVSLSLILSISFVRSRHIEKEVNKEKEVHKKKEADQKNAIALKKLNEEKRRVRNLDKNQKKEYLEEAIQNFDEQAIKLIISEKHVFQDIMPQSGDFVYYAAKVGGDDLVKHIKTLGVNLDEPFNLACSAIHYAIEFKDIKTLQCLINNGANLTKTLVRFDVELQEVSVTPLMEAAGALDKESVALLLSRGEVKDNIDAVSELRNTALIGVFYQRKNKIYKKEAQYDVAKLLLDHGADPTIENKYNQTALSLAQKNNCDLRVISLLGEAEKEWSKKHKEDNNEGHKKEDKKEGSYLSRCLSRCLRNGKESQVPYK